MITIMTEHDIKSLSLTLLNNSRISGVVIKEKSTQLSDVGHGLYVESTSGDRYADLRSCALKPFWGHTHPIKIQDSFNLLPKNEISAKWQSINESKVNAILQSSALLCDPNLKNLEEASVQTSQTLIVKLSEKDYLKIAPIWIEIEQQLILISSKRPLIILERNLLVFSENNISLTHNVNCEKILEFSGEGIYLTNSSDNEIKSISPLASATLRFYNNIAFSVLGKIKTDREIMDHFIHSEQLQANLTRTGHYLKLHRANLVLDSFLSQGLLVDDEQIQESYALLCIPCSCTKDELLDTLNRIKKL